MKVKTSITLSEDIVKRIDRLAGRDGSRSEIIEKVLRTYLGDLDRHRRDARELELLNRHADELNREALDVLEFVKGL